MQNLEAPTPKNSDFPALKLPRVMSTDSFEEKISENLSNFERPSFKVQRNWGLRKINKVKARGWECSIYLKAIENARKSREELQNVQDFHRWNSEGLSSHNQSPREKRLVAQSMNLSPKNVQFYFTKPPANN